MNSVLTRLDTRNLDQFTEQQYVSLFPPEASVKCQVGRPRCARAVWKDQRCVAGAARQRSPKQSAVAEGGALCCRAGLQMARSSGLPKRFGRWHTIYTRMNRWSKNGVLDRVFEKLQAEQIVRIKIEAFALDSTSIKVHPDGTGALKKTDPRPSASRAADGTPRFIWLPRMLERP